MTRFLTQDSSIPPYMAFPRFLLDKDGLNETAKILYTILLDRARLSQKNDGWTDEKGHVFIFFPIKNLAEAMHKSEMSIKTALMALEKENLIVRKRQGAGFPNRIYVKYPPEYLTQMDRNLSVRQTENCPTDGKQTVSVTDRKLSSSNKEKNNPPHSPPYSLTHRPPQQDNSSPHAHAHTALSVHSNPLYAHARRVFPSLLPYTHNPLYASCGVYISLHQQGIQPLPPLSAFAA